MSQRVDLFDDIDLSITRLPIFWEQADEVPEPLYLWHYRGQATHTKDRFWRNLTFRTSFQPLGRSWFPTYQLENLNADLPLHHFELLSNERIEELEDPPSMFKPARPYKLDWRMEERLEQCTPQFFLRNIPRVKREVDVSEPPPFSVSELPTLEDFEPSNLDTPKPEFIEQWNGEAIGDIALFLQETLALCQWEEIPNIKRATPEELEGTSWDPALSQSAATSAMLSNSSTGTVFAFGARRRPVAVANVLRGRSRRFATVVSGHVNEESDETTPIEDAPTISPPPPSADADQESNTPPAPDIEPSESSDDDDDEPMG